jgi:hypothetical protein
MKILNRRTTAATKQKRRIKRLIDAFDRPWPLPCPPAYTDQNAFTP